MSPRETPPTPQPAVGGACLSITSSSSRPPHPPKVDGFTRKSVRKAQRQKRSQGSSQFRSQSSQVELSPLPQLKGTHGQLKSSPS
uniref:Uncharacterized protein n=1 Tax=Pavo cristatus TaxID=9049 RepID=A0A8C9FCW7_PAVCR